MLLVMITQYTDTHCEDLKSLINAKKRQVMSSVGQKTESSSFNLCCFWKFHSNSTTITSLVLPFKGEITYKSLKPSTCFLSIRPRWSTVYFHVDLSMRICLHVHVVKLPIVGNENSTWTKFYKWFSMRVYMYTQAAFAMSVGSVRTVTVVYFQSRLRLFT